MTITRTDVADLQPGDVVELRHRLFPEITLRGPISVSGARGYDLVLPPVWIRSRDGEPGEDLEMWGNLTVVSRAPRRLYVNSDRTEPVPGDVVRDDSDLPSADTWAWVQPTASNGHWRHIGGGLRYTASEMPTRLRLLVVGETGLPPADSQ